MKDIFDNARYLRRMNYPAASSGVSNRGFFSMRRKRRGTNPEEIRKAWFFVVIPAEAGIQDDLEKMKSSLDNFGLISNLENFPKPG